MTYILLQEERPITTRLDANSQPIAFVWNNREFRIEEIWNAYRVPDGSFEAPIWREYFQITTSSGWLMLIYHDLLEGVWGLEMVYD